MIPPGLDPTQGDALVGVCSRCHENTSFHWDEVEKDYVSDCCTAYAVAPEGREEEPF